jgi:putative PIN family toxin of toxin-antitoxin system
VPRDPRRSRRERPRVRSGRARPRRASLRAFDALLDERIEVVGCPVLLGEVASVLGRDRLRRYLSIDEARRFVADLAAVMSLVADPPPPHPAVCRDPDDDYLVALARAARIDALVTGDRDLLVLEDIGVPVHATSARRGTGRCPVELRASDPGCGSSD